MTISYGLMIQPRWNIVDLTGKQLGAGYILTFNSATRVPTVFFKDIGGTVAWPPKILFDANGMVGPFYGASDSTDPSFAYYIEVYDKNDVLQFTMDNLQPSGTGGGGAITTTIDLANVLINSIFYANSGTTSSPFTDIFLCPSLHAGFGGNAPPDMRFTKNNSAAIDTVSFPLFPLGSNALTGDTTPQQYFRYSCTNSPVGETFKDFSIPVVKGVQNFSNNQMTFRVWARNESGSNTLTLSAYQFFGDGSSASAPVRSFIQTLTLTSVWTLYKVTFTVPSVTGKTIGECGNDALYLKIGFPLGVASTNNIAKPELYLGPSVPTASFDTIDDIQATTAAARTGDVRVSLGNTLASTGFVPLNDGNIGSAASSATTRANVDTFPLFEFIWNNVSDANAPVSGGRGANAMADFSANKTIGLTKQLGRVIASVGIPSAGGTGTNWAVGDIFGEEQHTLTIPEMPSHDHTPNQINSTYFASGGGPTASISGSPGGHTNNFNNVGMTGGGLPHNTIQPTVHYRFFIKL